MLEKSCRTILFFCIVFQVIGNAHASFNSRVSVNSLSPEPNYTDRPDGYDLHLLTDSKLEKYPIWRHHGTAGWRGRTPVEIKLTLKNNARQTGGTLRIHSARGDFAGVKPPRQIDVYTKNIKGEAVYLSSVLAGSGNYEDNNSHWINLNIGQVENELILIFHADGKFIFIDEIEWVENKKPIGLTSNIRVENVRKDSISRLRHNLSISSESTLDRYPAIISDEFINGMGFWLQNPWLDFSEEKNVKLLSDSPINIYGKSNEKETICIGMYNNTNGDRKITIDTTGSNNGTNAISVRQVLAVQAFSGNYVHDPLIDIINNEIIIGSKKTTYIWFTVDLAKYETGKHKININIMEKNNSGSLKLRDVDLNLHVYNATGDSNKLSAINWAYSDNFPIWKNRQLAYADLKAHGVNIFVLPPRAIPGINLDGEWEGERKQKMVSMLDLYKKDGMILFFLGWSVNKNPLGITNKNNTLDIHNKNRLKEWLVNLSVFLKSRGYKYDNWALYPVDEFNKSSLSLLKQVLEIVKETDLNIQTYVNPSDTKSRKKMLDIEDLESIEDYVDIWQPRLGFAKDSAATYFSGYKGKWWIYHNPTSPAKASSPFYDYRMISWWAWKLGASGVGFWSYDDTSKSSAWNDFDSKRPDWAVVYEGDNAIVSSRRWEAFREGLEDYELLQDKRFDGSIDIENFNLDKLKLVRKNLFLRE